MRVGITFYPTVGGSGTVATELGLQLARRDHAVHFIAQRLLQRPDEFLENVRFHEVDRTSLGLFEDPPNDLALAAKMAEVARENRLDIFHVHYAMPYAVTGFLARAMLGKGAPRLVTTLHGTDITLVGQDRSFYEVTRFGIESSDAVTSVSEFLRKETADELQVRRPIDVIPNFVDTAAHCPTRAYKDRQAFANPGERILLHTSNFRPVKRVSDVVRIVERVNREVPAVLLMAGEGPERAQAQALARRLGIAERVRFLGQVESPVEITGMADVFLLPSELESFGLAALEAMACGVPVVASNVSAIPEFASEAALLIDPRDAEQLCDSMERILRDKRLQATLKRRGIERAKEFSWERAARETVAVYQEVAAKR